MQALKWTAPDHAREVLLEQPATCLDPAAPADAAVGEALFNAPALLGGQAERAGLSCAGCHANGRRSAWFQLDGISAAAGTADVSSSFFALARANAAFDPKPIPDPALPGKIARDPASGALEPFLRGLIVEEFSGAEPTPLARAALAAYVRAVRTCPGLPSKQRLLADDLGLLDRSVEAASAMSARGDPQTARVLIKAARFRLGLISERLTQPGMKPLRRRLSAAAFELAGLEHDARPAGLAAWQVRFGRRLAPALVRNAKSSLYDPQQVDSWLARRN